MFTFIYSPLPENTVYTNTTTTVVSGTTPTTPPDNTSSTSEESSAAEEDNTESSAVSAVPEPTSPPEENILDNDVPQAGPPKDKIDLDDNLVPMANFEEGVEKLNSDGKMLWNHLPLAAKIAGGVAMLGGFSVALWFLIFRRRRKEEQ